MTSLLTERNAAIHDYRVENPTAGPTEIARHFDISRHSARRAMNTIDSSLELMESEGVAEIASDMGLKAEHIRHGWAKSDKGSFFFKRQDEEAAKDNEQFIENIKEAFADGYVLRHPVVARSAGSTDSRLMNKYVIADFHLGMGAWADECGDEYNPEIAEKSLFDTMEMMVGCSPNASHALIVNLGDYFHANDSKNRTPASGHILDVTGKYAQIARVGIRVMKAAIYKALEKHDTVEYLSVPGNHDVDQNHWLTIALSEHFEKNPRVKFAHIGRNFHVIQHGKNMLGFHHGHGVKFATIAMAMAASEPKMWGDTVFRYADTGHIHHKKEEEFAGVVIRSHRAMTAPDSYSNSHLYFSGRGMTSATYHTERGEIQTNTVNFFKGKPV